MKKEINKIINLLKQIGFIIKDYEFSKYKMYYIIINDYYVHRVSIKNTDNKNFDIVVDLFYLSYKHENYLYSNTFFRIEDMLDVIKNIPEFKNIIRKKKIDKLRNEFTKKI